ncbi:MAG: sulfatase family protein [Limisphaerales bacterium]
MKRLLSIPLCLVALLALGQAQAAKRPNILFMMSDDHASEGIGAYGSWLKDYVHTPTIDRLAAEGMRFTNVCCNNSICSPSRASIISGQYSHVTGALNLGCELKPNAPSYIRELTNSGYETCVVGKWHMKQFPRGTSDYAVTVGQGSYFNPTLHRPNGKREKYQGYYADRYTDWALKWLKQRDKTKPFYLSLHFKGPHEYFDYPERWAKLHEGVKLPEPPSLHEDITKTSPLLKGKHFSVMYDEEGPKSFYLVYEDFIGKQTDDPAERRSLAYQHLIHKYIRCVAAIDDNVKRVIDQLRAEGTLDNTLVIYTSDQGYWLGQHNMHDKRLILEESLKMPLIVRYPKEIKAGSVNTRLGMNIDFGPTMLDYAGVAIPSVMQGVSLRPLLQGNTPADWRTSIFYAYYNRSPKHWGIRTDRYKLIRFPDTEVVEFYDLQEDPQEMYNRGSEPGYSKQIATTQKQLNSLMTEVGVTRDFLIKKMGDNSKLPPGIHKKRKKR